MVNSNNEVIKMFLIKKLCFEIGGISAEISEDISAVLDTDWTDGNSLVFKRSDGRYSFNYEISRNCMGTKEALIDSQQEICYKIFPVGEIELNGLKGHHSTYSTNREQYFEARFLIDKTEGGDTEFVFVLWTENNDIEDIKASPDFKKLLNGIRKKDIIA